MSDARKFPPLAPDHPIVGRDCGICGTAFEAGDELTLVHVGPADADAAKRRDEGRPFNAVAVPIHWDCRPAE